MTEKGSGVVLSSLRGFIIVELVSLRGERGGRSQEIITLLQLFS